MTPPRRGLRTGLRSVLPCCVRTRIGHIRASTVSDKRAGILVPKLSRRVCRSCSCHKNLAIVTIVLASGARRDAIGSGGLTPQGQRAALKMKTRSVVAEWTAGCIADTLNNFDPSTEHGLVCKVATQPVRLLHFTSIRPFTCGLQRHHTSSLPGLRPYPRCELLAISAFRSVRAPAFHNRLRRLRPWLRRHQT